MNLRSWDQLVTWREAIPQHFFRVNNTEDPFLGARCIPPWARFHGEARTGQARQSPGETGATLPRSGWGAGGGTGVSLK